MLNHNEQSEIETTPLRPSDEASTLGDNRLRAIAAEIAAAHRGFESASLRTATHALHAGKLLIEAKELVGHGRFGAWVRENCDFGMRTAQYYMYAVRTGRNAQSIAHLGIKAAREAVARAVFAKEANKERRHRSAGGPAKPKLWQRPTRDKQVLYVEWEEADGGEEERESGSIWEKRAYVWLPTDAHAWAEFQGAKYGPGPAALEYEYVFLSYYRSGPGGELIVRHSASRPRGEARSRSDFNDWYTVAAILNTWGHDAGPVRVQEVWDGDDITLHVLDELKKMAPITDNLINRKRNEEIRRRYQARFKK